METLSTDPSTALPEIRKNEPSALAKRIAAAARGLQSYGYPLDETQMLSLCTSEAFIQARHLHILQHLNAVEIHGIPDAANDKQQPPSSVLENNAPGGD